VKHPAEFFIKYLIIREPNATDGRLTQELQGHGFLPPADDHYYAILHQEIDPPPAGFNPLDRTHRASMQYLRNEAVYELFYPDQAMADAMEVLSDQYKRRAVEQVILSRLDFKIVAQKLNKKYNWFLTADILHFYQHYFWNVDLLSFDHWGRYLFSRSAMYENYMGLLMADQKLAYFHLRLEQTLESKAIIKRAQEIAYFALEEVNQIPGVKPDKIKAIGVLNKAVTDCHNALNTSDMAMGGVLKQLERFRVVPSELPARSIHLLAPKGNYTGSGADDEEAIKARIEREKVH
jgi:hypothetical protein